MPYSLASALNASFDQLFQEFDGALGKAVLHAQESDIDESVYLN